jgi:hypothetical protein
LEYNGKGNDVYNGYDHRQVSSFAPLAGELIKSFRFPRKPWIISVASADVAGIEELDIKIPP